MSKVARTAYLNMLRQQKEQSKVAKPKTPAVGLGSPRSPQTPTTRKLSSPQSRVSNYVAKLRAMRERLKGKTE
jgi:hypothetical protein|tara:strand:- start:353 stop:571 length:219 start_codon:yes stop_codon:yes gene_type:complete